MAAIAKIVGDHVLIKRGGDMVSVPTAEAVGSSKYVALYFSAHCELTSLLTLFVVLGIVVV